MDNQGNFLKKLPLDPQKLFTYFATLLQNYKNLSGFGRSFVKPPSALYQSFLLCLLKAQIPLVMKTLISSVKRNGHIPQR